MDKNQMIVMRKRIEKTIANLESNNMTGIYVEHKEDVAAKVAELIPAGATVAMGGSMSLVQTGVSELLQSGNYHFLNRATAKTAEERTEIQRAAFSADVFLASSNAITESGKLYNVDGYGNRVAAILYGPASVILVVGCNKLCKDINKASIRVKTTAAPANSVRLGCNTYCAEKGECMAFVKDENPHMTSGCNSPDRICCDYVICARQRIKGRIKVILVGEELGY